MFKVVKLSTDDTDKANHLSLQQTTSGTVFLLQYPLQTRNWSTKPWADSCTSEEPCFGPAAMTRLCKQT